MRIRMTRSISGVVRGVLLPRRGETIDLDDKLAQRICQDGLAVPVPTGADVEARPAPQANVETRPAPEPEPTPDTDPEVSSGPDAASVRAWALGQGLDVPDRGRLPQALYDAYTDAHA